MSANPVAFNWLRSETYRFANQHGRNRELLRRFCFERMREWRRTDPEGEELSERAGDELAYDVADWVAEKYRPKKKRPNSTREQRDFERDGITFWIEELEAAGKRPSARNVAAWAQYSKSKAARLLNDRGIAPGREAKVARLSAKAQQVYRILDWNLRGPGQVVLSLDGLIQQLWPPRPKVEQKKSARSMQKKRFKKLINEIQLTRLGFHISVLDGAVVVRRGRRWKRKEIVIYLEEQKERGRIFAPFIPPEPVRNDLFWSQPEIKTCVGLMRFSIQRHLCDLEFAMPLVNAMRFSFDCDPIKRAINRALRLSDEPIDYLGKIAKFVQARNDSAGNAIAKFASIAEWMISAGGGGCDAKLVLDGVFERSDYLSKLEYYDKTAGNRVRFLVDQIIQYGPTCEQAIERCERFAEEEKANLWSPTPIDEKAIQRAIEDIPF